MPGDLDDVLLGFRVHVFKQWPIVASSTITRLLICLLCPMLEQRFHDTQACT